MKTKDQVKILRLALEEVLHVIEHDGHYSDKEFIEYVLALDEED